MFSIGEFSKITGLTVKTLRFYHEQGLLVPTCVDDQTGYRYYAETKINVARAIAYLRALDFPLAEIEVLLKDQREAELIEALQRHKRSIELRIKNLRTVKQSLDELIQELQENQIMSTEKLEIQEKVVEAQLIAGVRMKGRYQDCGQGFSKIGRRFGRHICGKPLLLCYDHEFREDDADFETCMPIRKWQPADGISVRELPGGRCVSLLHKGPYDQLGRSYAKLLSYVKTKNYKIATPCREIFIKGPGMIFRGNPKKYLTEIQFLISGDND